MIGGVNEPTLPRGVAQPHDISSSRASFHQPVVVRSESARRRPVSSEDLEKSTRLLGEEEADDVRRWDDEANATAHLSRGEQRRGVGRGSRAYYSSASGPHPGAAQRLREARDRSVPDKEQ